jgi:protein phosphatase
MRTSTFAATDTGLVRTGNEDSSFRGDTVLAVADGLGGHQAGEVASAIAISAIAELDGREFATPEDAREALVAAILQGNLAVLDKATRDPDSWGMGTTMTAAALVGGGRWAQLAQVGDSRAYFMREGEELRQVTDDQTIVGELVRQGRLTKEEAAHHPQRSVVTRAVGLDPNLEVDTPEPIELAPADQLLLCSDGLTDAVDDTRIAEILGAGLDGQVTCQALIDAANAAGGPDNITVVLLRVTS